jgi:hypothetical protein
MSTSMMTTLTTTTTTTTTTTRTTMTTKPTRTTTMRTMTTMTKTTTMMRMTAMSTMMMTRMTMMTKPTRTTATRRIMTMTMTTMATATMTMTTTTMTTMTTKMTTKTMTTQQASSSHLLSPAVRRRQRRTVVVGAPRPSPPLGPQRSILDDILLTRYSKSYLYLCICGLCANKNPEKSTNTHKTPSEKNVPHYSFMYLHICLRAKKSRPKYQEIPTDTDRKIPIQYNSIVVRSFS